MDYWFLFLSSFLHLTFFGMYWILLVFVSRIKINHYGFFDKDIILIFQKMISIITLTKNNYQQLQNSLFLNYLDDFQIYNNQWRVLS